MPLTRIERIVFTSLLRQCKILIKNNNCIWLQAFPKSSEYQNVRPTTTLLNDLQDNLKMFPVPIFHYLQKIITSRQIRGHQLRDIVRSAFRCDILSNSSEHNYDLFGALRIVNEQALLAKATSVKETNNIKVAVTAFYNNKLDSKNEYLYRITIENHGTSDIQLLGRYWKFGSDEYGTEIEFLKFEIGVLGLMPIIQAGCNFTYMSRVNLKSDKGGYMLGVFKCVDIATGTEFDVEIASSPLNPAVSTRDDDSDV